MPDRVGPRALTRLPTRERGVILPTGVVTARQAGVEALLLQRTGNATARQSPEACLGSSQLTPSGLVRAYRDP